MRISDWSSDVCSSDLRRSWRAATPQSAMEGVRDRAAGRPLDLVGHSAGDDCDESIDRRLARPRGARTDCPERPRLVHLIAPAGRAEAGRRHQICPPLPGGPDPDDPAAVHESSEEHMSELKLLMRILYAAFCLKTKTSPGLPRPSLHSHRSHSPIPHTSSPIIHS